ncbi:ferredoxin--NADP reductase [Haloarcula litorea]|uniref:ferredoxin--NADP reductase n=1 Tax=Haloarcula litorea TaxID=3032579 RepID=UPI0023E84FA5|nr:FAD-dependent oxidoreductase [Halomicroarcula sp. GDY20]
MTVTATIAGIHQLTPDVKQFRLVADDHRFTYEVGQHTMVHFENDGEEAARPYTAVNLPRSNELVLAIKRYEGGNGSVYMHERTTGDEVEVEPVDGDLTLQTLDRDVAFIATGTGITPILPMLKQYARGGTGDAHLLFGERDEEHLIFHETLDQLRSDYREVTLDYVLSEPADSWHGRTGHVQEHVPDALGDLDATDVYVCGVPDMVVETTDLLTEAGVDEGDVYTEGWESEAAGD